MEHRIRRVVTTHDESGKAAVLFAGIAPNTRVRAGAGFVSTLLWVTEHSPARYVARDAADVQMGVAPPPKGAVFRIVDFPPVTEGAAGVDHARLIQDMGVGHHGESGAPPRHPYMHRTQSVDFGIILSGEIDMLVGDADVHLTAGDVVVQQGTNHAWVNRGREICRIAFVLLDAEDT